MVLLSVAGWDNGNPTDIDDFEVVGRTDSNATGEELYPFGFGNDTLVKNGV